MFDEKVELLSKSLPLVQDHKKQLVYCGVLRAGQHFRHYILILSDERCSSLAFTIVGTNRPRTAYCLGYFCSSNASISTSFVSNVQK